MGWLDDRIPSLGEVDRIYSLLESSDSDIRPQRVCRTIPAKPSSPALHQCSKCNASVYRVTSADGEIVELDVEPIDYLITDDYGNTVPPFRESYRHQLLLNAGGHKLLEPTLFMGWVDDRHHEHGSTHSGTAVEPEWQWYSRKCSLEESFVHDIDVHALHHETCIGLTLQQLLGIISHPETRVRADVVAARRRTRQLNIAAQRQHAALMSEPVRDQAVIARPEPQANKRGQYLLF